jgi:hypothetical protein
MQWCVCKNIDGEMFIQSRMEREIMLDALIAMSVTPPTFVIKTFDTKEEAISYVANIHCVDKLINKIIE